jgi:phospholipase C
VSLKAVARLADPSQHQIALKINVEVDRYWCHDSTMTNPLLSRRQVLAGGLGAAAALGTTRFGIDTRKLVRAAASTPAAGSDIGAIKHVVFLMHENRSFDHYFGMLKGVTGFADHNNSAAFSQAWPGNSSPLLPYHLVSTNQAECTDDLSHSWQAEHASWNGGAMDSFVSTHTSDSYEGPDYGTLTMGYYESSDIPFYYDLADNFTICDNYFCSVLGPTHPNRLMQMTGTIDPTGSHGGPVLVTNSSQDVEFTCSWGTMPEVLTDAGVSWRVYNPYGNNYTPGSALSMLVCKNPLMYFDQYKKTNNPTLFQNAFGYYGPNVPASDPGLTSGKGPDNFAADVKNGTLPKVSWIIPPVGYDEHPPAPAALGEWYTAQILKTLMSNKAVWESTALFIMYDENDGFFDHVPPPTAPASTPGEYVTASTSSYNGGQDATFAHGEPIGLGVRVPMLVVSPFSQGGWVCSDVFDHTSQLQLLAELFGVDGTVGGNVSSWRQGTVKNLTSALPAGPTVKPNGKLAWPKKPKLAKTSDNIKKAPIGGECLPGDLVEAGRSTQQIPCTTTSGSTTVKSTDSFKKIGIFVGQSVVGVGIPNGTTVRVVKTSSITISNAATHSGTATLSFPEPYRPYPVPNPQHQPVPMAPPTALKATPT